MRRSLVALALASLAAALVVTATGFARHRQNPPPAVLISKAGTQRAAQETFCVFWPPHGGETNGGGICADSDDLPPRRLSVVRPREVVTIAFRGATQIRGRGAVRLLGKERYVARFRVTAPRTRWRVRLRPGAYEVEVEVEEFRTADGHRGDTSVSLGLLVDRKRRLAIVPLSAARPTPELTG